MIEKSRVRVPAGAAEEFSSPASTFYAVISVSVPPPSYRSSKQKNPAILPKV